MSKTIGDLPIKTLKEKLGLSSASLSRMLSSLYTKELIKRSFSKSGDKRQILITLSKKGEKKLKKIQKDIEEKIETKDIKIPKLK